MEFKHGYIHDSVSEKHGDFLVTAKVKEDFDEGETVSVVVSASKNGITLAYDGISGIREPSREYLSEVATGMVDRVVRRAQEELIDLCDAAIFFDPDSIIEHYEELEEDISDMTREDLKIIGFNAMMNDGMWRAFSDAVDAALEEYRAQKKTLICTIDADGERLPITYSDGTVYVGKSPEANVKDLAEAISYVEELWGGEGTDPWCPRYAMV